MKLNSKIYRIVGIILLVITLGFAGYRAFTTRTDKHDDSPETSAELQKHDTEAKSEQTDGTVITSGDSEFGTMLFNDKQQAIYIWEKENSTKPECYQDCAGEWPPVLTDGASRAAGSVDSGLLGTTVRADGSTQVTYNGHPLYYYAHEKAGEVTCHNVNSYGGLWWVVRTNGARAA